MQTPLLHGPFGHRTTPSDVLPGIAINCMTSSLLLLFKPIGVTAGTSPPTFQLIGIVRVPLCDRWTYTIGFPLQNGLPDSWLPAKPCFAVALANPMLACGVVHLKIRTIFCSAKLPPRRPAGRPISIPWSAGFALIGLCLSWRG